MKICVIHNLYPPYERGGAEKVVETLVRGLREKHVEVVFITLASEVCPKKMIECEKQERLTIYRFVPRNLFHYLSSVKYGLMAKLVWHFFHLFNLHSYFVIRRILRREKPDLVWTHNLMGLGFLIPLAIRNAGIRHYHTLHDVQLAVPSGLILAGKENAWEQRTLLRVLYEKIVCFLFGSPDLVLSPSQWLMSFYIPRGFFRKSLKKVLQNPLPTSFSFTNVQNRNNIETSRRDVGASLRQMRFLFVGQIEEQKGIFFLLEIFQTLLKEFSNMEKRLRLDIVGDGRQIETLRSMALCREIIIHGRKDQDELLEFYQKADYLIVPSLCYENSPTVIFESLYCATPVIAVDIGGAGEMIENGVNGHTFRAGDREDLLRVLRLAIEKPIVISCEYQERFKREHSVERYLQEVF